jgi:hypothetical protein
MVAGFSGPDVPALVPFQLVAGSLRNFDGMSMLCDRSRIYSLTKLERH